MLIFDQPEYVNTITAVTMALIGYPEAREAVLKALQALRAPKVIEAMPSETKH